jgi:folate-binding protein YgfZ
MHTPILLSERGILALTGKDRKLFLQGLMTNDISLLTPSHSLYSALLTPQGKILHDFFLIEEGETILLETQKAQIDLLKKRLNLYKLRSQIMLEEVTDSYKVFVIPPSQEIQAKAGYTQPWQEGLYFIDPRCSLLGARWIVHRKNLPPTFSFREDKSEYEILRIKLGIPEMGKDMISERSIPLEVGLHDLNAISWSKGCYLGQELTARTKYRGELRKRLLPVEVLSQPFDSLKPIFNGSGEKAGELHSFLEGFGIARLRLEHIKTSLFIDSIPLKVHIPCWVSLSS